MTLADQLRRCRRVHHVGSERQDLRTRVLERRRSGREPDLATRGDRHIATLRRQATGSGKPDTAAPAGDQGNPAAQMQVHSSNPRDSGTGKPPITAAQTGRAPHGPNPLE